jgi:hypothetical protein
MGKKPPRVTGAKTNTNGSGLSDHPSAADVSPPVPAGENMEKSYLRWID